MSLRFCDSVWFVCFIIIFFFSVPFTVWVLLPDSEWMNEYGTPLDLIPCLPPDRSEIPLSGGRQGIRSRGVLYSFIHSESGNKTHTVKGTEKKKHNETHKSNSHRNEATCDVALRWSFIKSSILLNITVRSTADPLQLIATKSETPP